MSKQKFIKMLNSSKWQGKINQQNYPMTLADSDLPLFGPFNQKLIKAIKNVNNLTYKNRSRQYFESIIDWYKRHHLVKDLNSEMFIQCPSICNLIASSILAYTNENDKILIMTPVYSFYMISITELKRKVMINALKQVKDQNNIYHYQFDGEDFIRKITLQKPKLLILCHPHNPCGKIFTKSQLDLIVSECEKQSTYILSDQIMGDFNIHKKSTQNKQHSNSFYSLVNYSYSRIIVGNSISKVFNCSSIQGGYGVIRSQNQRSLYNKISGKAFKHLTNQIALLMTPIIYAKQGEQWIRWINEIINQNYKLLVKTLSQFKFVKTYHLQSSFLTVIQFDTTELSKCRQPTTAIESAQSASVINTSLYVKVNHIDIKNNLQLNGIYFVDMQSYFYPTVERSIFRLSIAVQTDAFKRFIQRFNQVLFNIKKSIDFDHSKINQLRRSKL